MDKTRTLFGYGSNSERGICMNIAVELISRINSDETPIELVASFVEIYTEKYYDLITPSIILFILEIHPAKRANSKERYEECKLTDITNVSIKTEDQILTIIKNGLLHKKKIKELNINPMTDGHLILIITLQESDSGKIRSKLYFTEIADIKDSYEETDFINLESALKCFSSSKFDSDNLLIKAMDDLFRQENDLCLIGHIEGKNLVKSLQALQYAERCNNKKSAEDIMLNELQITNREYKKRFEEMKLNYTDIINYIKRICGINLDIEKIISTGPSFDEEIALDNYRQANERLVNYRERKNNLEKKLDKMRRIITNTTEKIEDKKMYYNKLSTNLKKELDDLTKYSTQLKTDYGKINSNMSQEINANTLSKINKIHSDVKGKFDCLFDIDKTLSKTNNDMFEATRIYKGCKRNLKERYEEETKHKKKSIGKSLSELADQYEQKLRSKEKDLTKFMSDAKEVCTRIKNNVKLYRRELLLLEKLVKNQSSLICDAECGKFTKGMMSLTIPMTHKGIFMSKRSFDFNNRSVSTSMSRSRKNRYGSRPNTSIQYNY